MTSHYVMQINGKVCVRESVCVCARVSVSVCNIISAETFS